ncbi:hypothetical protein cypCar_00003631 [Cyprinus carpio]|nr:hypothetical protein cypCar_00003631 [Cyprinus carpio]
MCKGPCVLGSSNNAPDADLLGMLGADSLGRLKHLQQCLVQPQGLFGPCPPPSFPGHQEFFKHFLQTASCCQLNQHLKDGLCQQLLKLDEVSILAPDASPALGEETGDGDMEQQDEKQRFSTVLLTARLLAQFLSFISFLPYQTTELPSRDIQDAAITLRSKSSPVLDVCAVLRSSVHRRRTILTVHWMVEFLSMLDYAGPFLSCYRTALCLLLQIYKHNQLCLYVNHRMVLGRGGELCYMNQLLMVAVLGWLFQIPIFPEDLFFSTDLKEEVKELEDITSSQGLVDLEQAFFHNQPPSLRRTVEFVAERISSNCVKHIKSGYACVGAREGWGENSLERATGCPRSHPVVMCFAVRMPLEPSEYYFLWRPLLLSLPLLRASQLVWLQKRLAAGSPPTSQESVEKFQQLSLATQFPLPSLPNHRNILQVSQ